MNETSSSPRCWSEYISFSDHLQRKCSGVSSVNPNGVAPPFERDVGQCKAQEDRDHSQCYTSIQTGAQDIVVAHPPPEMIATQEEIEEETSDAPGDIIDSGGRRDGTHTCKEDGNVDVAEKCHWETPSEEVEWDGQHRTK